MSEREGNEVMMMVVVMTMAMMMMMVMMVMMMMMMMMTMTKVRRTNLINDVIILYERGASVTTG